MYLNLYYVIRSLFFNLQTLLPNFVYNVLLRKVKLQVLFQDRNSTWCYIWVTEVMTPKLKLECHMYFHYVDACTSDYIRKHDYL